MSAPVDVRAVMLATESALVKAANGSPDALAQAARSCDARAAIAELIEAAIEMDAVFDTYIFDYGVTQHGLSVKDRIRAALARVGGGK